MLYHNNEVVMVKQYNFNKSCPAMFGFDWMTSETGCGRQTIYSWFLNLKPRKSFVSQKCPQIRWDFIQLALEGCISGCIVF
jgi:hypothetical protein